MKRITLLSFLSIFFLTSCGIRVADVKGVNNRLNTTVQEIYHNDVKNHKVGEACVTNILYLVAVGDSSVETAARNANITKISSVSTRYKEITIQLPFYQEGCTIVTGE